MLYSQEFDRYATNKPNAKFLYFHEYDFRNQRFHKQKWSLLMFETK